MAFRVSLQTEDCNLHSQSPIFASYLSFPPSNCKLKLAFLLSVRPLIFITVQSVQPFISSVECWNKTDKTSQKFESTFAPIQLRKSSAFLCPCRLRRELLIRTCSTEDFKRGILFALKVSSSLINQKLLFSPGTGSVSLQHSFPPFHSLSLGWTQGLWRIYYFTLFLIQMAVPLSTDIKIYDREFVSIMFGTQICSSAIKEKF